MENKPQWILTFSDMSFTMVFFKGTKSSHISNVFTTKCSKDIQSQKDCTTLLILVNASKFLITAFNLKISINFLFNFVMGQNLIALY